MPQGASSGGQEGYQRFNITDISKILNHFVQGAKERMAETKQRLSELLGPVLGLVEKQAPNQVTGRTCLVIHEK